MTTPKIIRVCFVSPKVYPLFNPKVQQPFGGAELDLYLLATELAKDSNFDVSCITADYGQEHTETVEHVTLIKSIDFNRNPLTSARRIWKAMKQANADIYMIKTASAGVPLVAQFCRRHRRGFVYRTAHQRECDGTWRREHPIKGRAFAWALRNAHAVFTQTKTDSKNLLSTLNITSTPIPNGHRLIPLTEHKKESILWVARSAKPKRPELFLKLARQFPNKKFTMICRKATGDNDYDALKAQATRTQNVRFIPSVPFDQIHSYFLKAKVFVSTSESEGFPNTFIQSCQAAVPILSLLVNPDHFLDRHQCGLCADGDWNGFIEMFERLQNSAVAQALGQNGRDYVKKYHDIQQIVQRYTDIFNEIL
ncbi:MAG: glycosyltransferase family 4 protein [Planctomycetes bacterium]|nr:glycosyltransferase family 4 protein [Planctomycetota bacterium]